MQKTLSKALNVLKIGGLILYPTDTIWGIGCDATNSEAISKVFDLKRRLESKALISLVANKKQLMEITGFIPNLDITSKPTTIIYPNVIGLSTQNVKDWPKALLFSKEKLMR